MRIATADFGNDMFNAQSTAYTEFLFYTYRLVLSILLQRDDTQSAIMRQ